VLQYIKILRPSNILIIFFTQILIRYCVLEPLLFSMDLALQMPLFDFSMLVAASILIASAGYVINDYFDVKTDRINRPESVIVDRIISRRKSMLWHIVLNGIGLFLALVVAVRAGNFQLFLIQFMTVGLLWFYSTDFKKQFFIGNFVVALLTALVPIVVVIYELPWQRKFYDNLMEIYNLNFGSTFYFVGTFALFAFLTNLVREIIKDIEDAFGDEATGCRTMPIVLGIDKTKYVIYFILGLTVLLLSNIVYANYTPRDILPTLYIVFLVILPLVSLFYFVFKAQLKKEFSFISRILKVVMVIGLCFSFIIYYLAHYGNNT
jgi:4-hydroxybenzoate polyprenyltransferase